jgi:membrane associated rhomboid family serine protease
MPHRDSTSMSRPDLASVALVVLIGIASLWTIHFLDQVLDLGLYRLGVYPDTARGLWGLAFAPVIHGSYEHLFLNSPPLFVLATLLLYNYPRAAIVALPVLFVVPSLGTWWFGRPSFHIGASGLTHGLMFFLFVLGILRRDRPAMAVSLIVFFLYGGMIHSILPQSAGVSFEMHLAGALGGILLAPMLSRRDPFPVRIRYQWEEASEEDDPIIGDLWRYADAPEEPRPDAAARPPGEPPGQRDPS